MKLEVRHLQLVDAITASGSVTRAAERLNVTQSALSHQLREIEDRLGTPLFLRVNRRLALAPAGERLLASARRVLDDLRLAEEDIERLATDQDGIVRLATECYTCYHWLPPLLKQFRKKFPRVEVEIAAEATRRTVDALLERKIDLALLYNTRADRRLRLVPVFEDEMIVITATDHPLAEKTCVVPADFAGENVILHSAPEESFFAEQLHAARVRPRRFSQVVLTEAIIEMVRAGLGVSAMPRWMVAHAGLPMLRFTKRGLPRKWSAATLRTAETAAPVAELIGLIKGRR